MLLTSTGKLVEIFGVQAFYCQELDGIVHDNLYHYVVLDSSNDVVNICTTGNHSKLFKGVAILTNDLYNKLDHLHKYWHGEISTHGRLLSHNSEWVNLDDYNTMQLKSATGVNMSYMEFSNNAMYRLMRSENSQCTMTALTNILILQYVKRLHTDGKYVAKSLNHYDELSEEVKTSEGYFYVEFSDCNPDAITPETQLFHIHLPYKYWFKLPVPAINHISKYSHQHQPNIGVLVKHIEDMI